MEIEQSIYIVLADTEVDVEGEKVGVVSQEGIDRLKTLVFESESLSRKANKLRDKTEQAKRQARKLLDRIVVGHGVKISNKEAVGVSKADDIIYVGDKDRIIANPELPPAVGDRIVGKLLKYERRKYNELLEKYNYIAGKIEDHNQLVQVNENSLIAFENTILSDKEYDKEKQYLVVSTVTGKVYLVTKE